MGSVHNSEFTSRALKRSIYECSVLLSDSRTKRRKSFHINGLQITDYRVPRQCRQSTIEFGASVW